MDLKPGARFKSAVCETEVIVVRAPGEPVELRCGGVAMVPIEDDAPAGATLSTDFADGTAIGKRYVDDARGLEVLCTKAGQGSLSIGDAVLLLKGAKPLPASD